MQSFIKISKKGKIFQNLGKNVQNLKIFCKKAASCVRLSQAWGRICPVSTNLILIKTLISFQKTWFLCKSKCLSQKNYYTTLAQCIKLKTNTNKLKNELEHAFQGYLKHWGSVCLFITICHYLSSHFCRFCYHPTLPKSLKPCGRSSLYRKHLIGL